MENDNDENKKQIWELSDANDELKKQIAEL